jgi:serine/threonine-protein kinase
LTLPPQPYTGPRISPDGTRIAVTLGLVSANNSDIWIYDLNTAAFNRFTFTQRDFAPIWSRNGKELYYSSGVTGKGVMAKSADGSSPAKVLLAKSGPIFPIAVSPDEHEITLNTATGASEGDLYLLDTRGGKDLMTILDTPDYEYGGAISPDGRYLLYGSGETGRLEVYISTYPDLKGKWQISENGGLSPIWSPNGREVFYVSTVGKMMSVSLERNGTLRPGKPRELFDASQMLFPNSPITNYDVAPDGQKFIMVRSVRSAAGITAFNVILNWTGELQSHIGVSD